MSNTRRGFLSGILAIGAAPAIVRADSLMKIVATKQAIVLPVSLKEMTRPGAYYDVDVMLWDQRSQTAIRYAHQEEFSETSSQSIVLTPKQHGRGLISPIIWTPINNPLKPQGGI